MRVFAADGATPGVCDVYDRATLSELIGGAVPDVVVHLLSDLPATFKPRADARTTDRVRCEGTRALLDAARAAGARRFIAESIAFPYDPDGSASKTGEDPVWLSAPGFFGETVKAVIDLEEQVLNSPMHGIALRFGWLYGPGTWYAREGSIGRDVGRRMYPIVGQGSGLGRSCTSRMPREVLARRLRLPSMRGKPRLN